MKRLTTHIPGGPRKGCCLQISCTCTDCLGKCVFPWNTGGLHSGTAWGSNIRPEGKEFTTYKKEYGSLGEERFRREGPERKHQSLRGQPGREKVSSNIYQTKRAWCQMRPHISSKAFYTPTNSTSLRPCTPHQGNWIAREPKREKREHQSHHQSIFHYNLPS